MARKKMTGNQTPLYREYVWSAQHTHMDQIVAAQKTGHTLCYSRRQRQGALGREV